AVNWWKKTPAHDKMHQVVEVPVGFLTNAILFGCCASFASKLATAACAEALAITRKSNPAITSAVATSEAVATAVQRTKAEAVKLLERLSEAEQVAQAPALKLLNEVIYDPKFPQFPAIVETAWQMTLETLQLAVEYITLAKDTKKLAHVFHGKHNFNDLVKHFNGCQITTLREILKAASGKIPAAGRFENFQIQVFNQIVHIQGCVINNVPKLSTAFIKLVGKP
ncbi:MAG TPA: hypothetical protein VGT41_02765, partial [Candidatus Babeliales bacterium]|nr:hypothetical protein [Candidatus Babeliales bacterium]